MKSRRNEGVSPKLLLALLTVICAALLGISCLFHDAFKPLSDLFAGIVIPMQDGINSAGEWFGENVGSFKTINELRSENEILSEKVEALTEENNLYKTKLDEYEDLQSLVKLAEDYEQYDTVAASVISNGSGNWYNEFVINKGTEDGITENMNVITKEGLVGIIADTGTNYAVVRSIIDDSSSVSAMSEKTSDTCIVKGNQESMEEDGCIEVSHISKSAEMEAGDQLVTSHISSKYLKGLIIGTVKDIEVDSGTLTKSASLVPAVDFENIEHVLVIQQLKEVPEGVDKAD